MIIANQIKKGVNILLVVIGLTAALVFIYNLDNPSVRYKVESDTNYSVVNLGTSHGNSFIYGFYGINGRRFNRGGNTIYYDLQVYRSIKNHLKKDALVIVPISYFSFGQEENDWVEEDSLDTNNFVDEYYHRLLPTQIKDYSLSRHSDLVSATIKENIPKIFSGHREYKTSKPSNFNAKAYLSDKNFEKGKKKFNLKDHGKRRSISFKKKASYIKDDRNINYLKSLIEEIKEDGFKPLLLLTPYHKEYNKHFSKGWVDNNVISKIKKANVKYNAPFLDYSHDQEFENKAGYFLNTDHLNRKGRILFTKKIFKDLKEKNITTESYLQNYNFDEFKNKKLTESITISNIELIKDNSNSFLLFHFTGDLTALKEEKLGIHYLDESNNKVKILNKKINSKENIHNTLVFKLPLSRFEKIEKVAFMLFVAKNKKAVSLSNKFELLIK
ncbi:hypothetical protein [Olleya namhaensis]|uniref:hypothetical protein n=1 Tax=Olleya namhaensis TaxID=1144750 RepID=UPI002492482A|nr:hypothetical protein [Olleya namhaensis]